NDFISKNIIPVVCAVSLSDEFQLLNTNADTMAMEIAKAMTQNFKVHLIYCFAKNGVLREVENDNSVIEILDKKEVKKMQESEQITDGMLPKLTTAFTALSSGVSEVKIINSEALKHYFNNEKTGTTVILN
ncbi:MAG: acetylglutamate kinase, partial [Cruoricaptor ignavus]|nr:acetylglutamate kinase [Cruoricaptor ignavus]